MRKVGRILRGRKTAAVERTRTVGTGVSEADIVESGRDRSLFYDFPLIHGELAVVRRGLASKLYRSFSDILYRAPDQSSFLREMVETVVSSDKGWEFVRNILAHLGDAYTVDLRDYRNEQVCFSNAGERMVFEFLFNFPEEDGESVYGSSLVTVEIARVTATSMYVTAIEWRPGRYHTDRMRTSLDGRYIL